MTLYTYNIDIFSHSLSCYSICSSWTLRYHLLSLLHTQIIWLSLYLFLLSQIITYSFYFIHISLMNWAVELYGTLLPSWVLEQILHALDRSIFKTISNTFLLLSPNMSTKSFYFYFLPITDCLLLICIYTNEQYIASVTDWKTGKIIGVHYAFWNILGNALIHSFHPLNIKKILTFPLHN